MELKWLCRGAVALAVAALSSPAADAQSTLPAQSQQQFSQVQLPARARPQGSDIKLHTQLLDVLDARTIGQDTLANLPKALRDGDRVLVEVRFREGESADASVATLARHGATLRNQLADNLHEAWLPLDRLRELATEADITSVTPARLARPLIGSKTSEGVAASNANLWQTFNPVYNGTGIKIAMIDGYDKTKIAALQSSNDWPPSSRLACFDLKGTAAGGTNPPYSAVNCTTSTFGSALVAHGEATMEIAYDVAPGASFRAYDTTTVGDWRNAILDAAHLNSSGVSTGAVNANVISASLAAPLDGKGDGTAAVGSIAEAAGFAKAHGVLVVNAAGNERLNHWSGAFAPASGVDSGFLTWSGADNVYNAFNNGSASACVSDGTDIIVEVSWNNWVSPGANHNFDVYLWQDISTSGNIPTWANVAASLNGQSGVSGQVPQEFIQYTTNGGRRAGCAAYSVSIARVAGTTSNDFLQVFASTSEGWPLTYRVTSNSLDFPADSPNVISVGAIDVANATNNPQETFSSEGPVLGTGGGPPTFSAGTDTNLKPDVASFDDVSTVTQVPTGATKFFGTSASTPQVAGMGALFMQRFGVQTTSATLTSAIITPLRTIASTGTNDLGTVGRDYQYGYGKLRFQQDASLYFAQQPTNTIAHGTMTPAVTVGVLDTQGKPDLYPLYTDVVLAIGNNPTGGTLSGGGSAPIVQGLATYPGLQIDTGGTGYTLTATSTPTGLTATSNAFNITTGAATKVVFTVEPTDVVAGSKMVPPVEVSVEDASGNIVPTGTHQITLQRVGCTGTVPSGGGPIAATAGVAMFPNLVLHKTGTLMQLQAFSGGLATATSTTFNVTANPDVVFQNGFETCTP